MLFEKIKLEEDEQILLIVRRHWFVLLMRMLSVVIPALFPFAVIGLATIPEQTSSFISLAYSNFSNQIIFISSVWLLLNWMILAYKWTDHYLDLWIVTDRRIISIDQKSLFVRNIGSFRLERLQDMNIEIPGFLATMFDYGNIEAETASGGVDEFKVIGMPNPREIKSIILEATDHRMKTMRTNL